MSRKIVAPQRRKQIVDALFDCLADSGHERVTVKDIARRAKLHYGVIHYYFRSKDEIVTEMADSLIHRYGSLLLQRIAAAESASEKMRLAVDFLVDEFIFNRRLNRVFYNLVQMAFEHEPVREALRRQLRVYRDHVEEVIKEGVASGEFSACESEKAAALMVALIEGTALQWVIDPKRLGRKEAHQMIRDVMERHLVCR